MGAARRVAAPGGDARLTERHVQALWYDRELRPPNLLARDGSPVRVIDPGTWNGADGPDFRNAVLEVGPGRRRLRGDVEVHLSPADWCRHGHGTDPAYRNVIAHVTWGCGPEPQTLPLAAVSIWIGRFVTANAAFTPGMVDLAAYPFARLPSGTRPCEACLREKPDRAHALLALAGRHRLRRKAQRLATRLARGGVTREQLLYEEVMAAYGYRRNAEGFRWIARAVPFAALDGDPARAADALRAAAGFVMWARCGGRPANGPGARLEAAARLFARPQTRTLLAVTDFSPAACREMIATLTAERTMGRGRAAAVLANVILPLALAERRTDEAPAWLPPEDLSEPVRLTAFRLFGRDHHPPVHYATNGLLIQGLIQIQRDHCLLVHPDCGRCALFGPTGGASP